MAVIFITKQRKLVSIENLKSTSNKNIKIIILLSILFNSCSLIYKICDYCNLKYNGIENIVITNDNNFSYHKKCVELYRKPKKGQQSYKKIMIDSDISDIIKEVSLKLSTIGINFNENGKNNQVKVMLKNGILNQNFKFNKPNPGVHIYKKYIIIQIVSKFDDVLKSKEFGFAGGKAIGNNVYIQEGNNVLRFKGILAHELTHVWQNQNKIGPKKINREGLAELVEAHIFKMDTTYDGKHMYKSQKFYNSIMSTE